MSNSATALSGAWHTVINGRVRATPEQIAAYHRAQDEDFRFMLLCEMKGNMAMYQLLRDDLTKHPGHPYNR